MAYISLVRSSVELQGQGRRTLCPAVVLDQAKMWPSSELYFDSAGQEADGEGTNALVIMVQLGCIKTAQ